MSSCFPASTKSPPPSAFSYAPTPASSTTTATTKFQPSMSKQHHHRRSTSSNNPFTRLRKRAGSASSSFSATRGLRERESVDDLEIERRLRREMNLADRDEGKRGGRVCSDPMQAVGCDHSTLGILPRERRHRPPRIQVPAEVLRGRIVHPQPETLLEEQIFEKAERRRGGAGNVRKRLSDGFRGFVGVLGGGRRVSAS
ncbi:hypothetical protein BDV98DRAFT_575730 [Pterulicium gracile]|uniref:Uncharacterized protein n=1 Tax=Pterulicium gracile TaxID=1884261 RepID=A0A5C3Q3N7_9AGAR|nr:hypothetical protein BDV98DRAFT_575730 [Pterula gracilis]